MVTEFLNGKLIHVDRDLLEQLIQLAYNSVESVEHDRGRAWSIEKMREENDPDIKLIDSVARVLHDQDRDWKKKTDNAPLRIGRGSRQG